MGNFREPVKGISSMPSSRRLEFDSLKDGRRRHWKFQIQQTKQDSNELVAKLFK